MAPSQVDLCGKESGPIFHKSPTPKTYGLLLEVSNTKAGLTPKGKHMQFTKVAFCCHGNWFVAGDQLGQIYQFDMAKNRFKLILKAGQSCTGLACCITRPTEVLVALADYTVKCVDVDTSQVVATLRGHESCVHSISLHSSGRYALAVSSRDSVLWDLETFTRCRTLNGGEEVGVQDVFFIPMTNTIVSCFKDDSIHAWDSTTLEYRYQIPPPYGPTPHYRAFAVPQDGCLMVGGGRSNFLHIWTMETRQLLRIVQLPPKIRHVKQLVFLPDSYDGGTSETLGFLGQDGIMRFINIYSCKLLFEIGSQDVVLTNVQPSPVGKHLVGVSEAGNIVIYDAAALGQELYQPPAPLVKVVDETDPLTKSVKVQKVRTSPASARKRGKLADHHITSLVPQSDGGRGEDSPEGPDTPQLNKDKLLSILKGYGEYPAKYRMFIWRCLLGLPDNHAAYSSLLDRGTHPSYVSLHKKYPIKSRKLLRVLQRALSALAHWASIFGEMEYLPGLVFPFVKMFQNNQLVTFEILATILMNWCGQWFEYFPNAPLNILAMVENCLAHHDPHLLQHFIKFNITSQLYAWPLLETLFSEVLSKGEWLRVWDNLISHHPGYMLLMVVAYITTARQTLFKCSQKEDFEFFFRNQNTVDIGRVIMEANVLQQTTPNQLHPELLLDPFVPLTKGTYPVFSKYPKYIVDYQVQERQRIRLEELEYLRERQSALELDRMLQQRKQEEEAWYRQQQQLMEAEDQRRKIMDTEERKLTDQRTRLQALKRELKVKELHVLDAARRRFLEHQQVTREDELRKMDDNIKKKVLHREKETQAVLQDIETRAVELERQKALLEVELNRCQEEMRQRLRAEANSELHSTELEKSSLEHALEEDLEKEKEKLDRAHSKLAQTQAQRAKEAAVEEARARRALREMKQDMRMEQVAEKERLNQLRRKNIQFVLDELQEENMALLKSDLSTTAATTSTVEEDVSAGPGGFSAGPRAGGGAESRGVGASPGAATRGKDEPLGNSALSSIHRDPRDSTSSTFADHSTLYPLQSDDSGSALTWSNRRTLLDQQESAMLSRIRELREKVASQMNATTRSHDTP